MRPAQWNHRGQKWADSFYPVTKHLLSKRNRRARDKEAAQEIKNAWADRIMREGH